MSSDTIYTLVSIVYVLVCLFLIAVVLLQSGRGGGMGAIGGGAGGGGQTVFGGAGAGNFLTRLTAICAALFMLLSATLAYLSTKGEQDAIRGLEAQEQAALEAVSDGDEEESTDAEERTDAEAPVPTPAVGDTSAETEAPSSDASEGSAESAEGEAATEEAAATPSSD